MNYTLAGFWGILVGFGSKVGCLNSVLALLVYCQLPGIIDKNAGFVCSKNLV